MYCGAPAGCAASCTAPVHDPAAAVSRLAFWLGVDAEPLPRTSAAKTSAVSASASAFAFAFAWLAPARHTAASAKGFSS